jgi:diguanylate cyclase (GGDEF)-like protein
VAADHVAGTPGATTDRDRPKAHALRVSALVALYAYLVALALGPHSYQFWREFWLQNSVLALLSSYLWVKIFTERECRSWRVPLAGWPTAFLGGNLLVNASGPRQSSALASASIAVMLLAYPCALAAIVQMHRGGWTAFGRGAVLDSLVASLAIWAGFAAFVIPSALHAARVGDVQPLLVLAVPICDLTILSLTVAAIAWSGTRPARMSGWMVIAILISALGDSSYAISSALGTWPLGTVMDGTWVVGCALVALGAGAGPPSPRTTRSWGAGVLIVSLLSASAAVALLVAGTQWHLNLAAVTLAAASAMVSLLRLADAYVRLRGFAETQRLAATDDLTGLANRRAFYREIEARLEIARPFVVLLVDLDGFKEVNDTLGHSVGDELLQAVARRLESGLPAGGLIARLGGDEFAVCVELEPPRSAAMIAAQLLASLDEPVVVGGLLLAVGASTGVSTFPAQAVTRTELLRQADVAMYVAKRAGGGVRVHRAEDDAALILPSRAVHGPVRARSTGPDHIPRQAAQGQSVGPGMASPRNRDDGGRTARP